MDMPVHAIAGNTLHVAAIVNKIFFIPFYIYNYAGQKYEKDCCSKRIMYKRNLMRKLNKVNDILPLTLFNITNV
jgi:hypothetical protein